ncbi:MAG TPA: LysM peptidoglycan-binding domain-containing protein [Roseiflexaceae bacterium]|nr:LysM peptidoglycan-binding domain-containing protein [Roseiflexaceae bacterium]
MLHRNTLITVCAIFCAIAIGAGLFVANISKPSGLVIQQPGVSATSEPLTTAPTSAPLAADAPTAILAPAPAPTDSPAATAKPAEPSATSQPEPTAAPTTTAVSPSAERAYIEYTVQKGDLLNNIAKKYNVTTKDILAINEIRNADSLTVGQVLRIPKV